MSAAVPIGFAAVGLAGDIYEGLARKQAAEFNAAMMEQLARRHLAMERLNTQIAQQNIAFAEQAAAHALGRGESAAAQARGEGTRTIATQRAGYAAGNIDVGSGTPVEVAAETRAVAELDAQTLRNNAALEAWGYEVQAHDIATRDLLARSEGEFERLQMRTQAALERQAGRNAIVASALGGGARFGAGVLGGRR